MQAGNAPQYTLTNASWVVLLPAGCATCDVFLTAKYTEYSNIVPLVFWGGSHDSWAPAAFYNIRKHKIQRIHSCHMTILEWWGRNKLCTSRHLVIAHAVVMGETRQELKSLQWYVASGISFTGNASQRLVFCQPWMNGELTPFDRKRITLNPWLMPDYKMLFLW